MFPVSDLGGGSKPVNTPGETIDERAAFEEKPEEKEAGKGKTKEGVEGTEEETEEQEEVEEKGKEDEEGQEEGQEEEEGKEDGEDDEDDAGEEAASDSLYQQLKALDKTIFKKIPELREVVFREREFTEVFPTIDDARQAKEAQDTFAQYQEDLMEGNLEPIMTALGKTDEKALENFAANFIPTLEKKNRDLYLNVLYPEFKKLIRVAAKNPDERISKAATNLHWWIFGDGNLQNEAGLKPRVKDEKDEKLSKREQEFEERIFRTFTGEVSTTCNTRLDRAIRAAFKDSGLSDLLQNSLTTEIQKRVDQELREDKRHMSGMGSLWRQAKGAGFTSEWKDRIANAYLSRAKLIVSKHRQKVLSEAKLGNTKIKIGETKRPTPSGQTPKREFSGSRLDIKKVDMTKTTERDLLEGKVVFKK